MERTTIGVVSATMSQLKQAGSSEYIRPGAQDDQILADLMKPVELETMYNQQMDGLRQIANEPRFLSMVRDTVDRFRVDLPTYQSHDIDTSEAQSILDRLLK